MATKLICTICGYAGYARKKNKGSSLIEIVLWLFILIPGLIYSIWRRSNKQTVCPKCGNVQMIPLDTPQGQRLMAEQRSNPNISKEALESKKPSNSGTKIALAVVMAVVVFVIIAIWVAMDDAKEAASVNVSDSNVEQAVQQPTSAVKKDLPTEPQARIETIVKNLGKNYEVTIFGKNPNVKPVSPYEVIVNTDAGNCAFAKQMNFDVMKALYTDSVAKKNIARVRFNARKHLSTSLGGDDARESTDKTWADSGPTNFLTVLTQMGSEDLSTQKMERQSWANPMEGCE